MTPVDLPGQIEAGVVHLLLVDELGDQGKGPLGQPGTVLCHCVDTQG